MKVSDILLEGSFVLKNKDGKTKRFRDDKSAEAKTWVGSSSPKPKVKAEKYSKDWWHDKYERSTNDDDVFPWDPIGEYELDGDVVEPILRKAGGGRAEDWTKVRQFNVDVKGVTCRVILLRVQFSFGKEDDMGLSDEDIANGENGRVSDTQSFAIRRDEKNPKKFVFAGYK